MSPFVISFKGKASIPESAAVCAYVEDRTKHAWCPGFG